MKKKFVSDNSKIHAVVNSKYMTKYHPITLMNKLFEIAKANVMEKETIQPRNVQTFKSHKEQCCVDAQWLSDGSGILSFSSENQIAYHRFGMGVSGLSAYTMKNIWQKKESIITSCVLPYAERSILISTKGMPLQLYDLVEDEANGMDTSDLPPAVNVYETSFSPASDGFDHITSICSSSTSSHFYTGSRRARLDMFDVASKAPVRTWMPSARRRRGQGSIVSMHQDNTSGNVFYLGTDRGIVTRVDQRSKDMDHLVSCGGTRSVAKIVQSSNGHFLYFIPKTFYGSHVGIAVWDLRNEDFIATFLTKPPNITQSVNNDFDSDLYQRRMGPSTCTFNEVHGLFLGSPDTAMKIHNWDRFQMDTAGINPHGEQLTLPTQTISLQKHNNHAEDTHVNIVMTNPNNFDQIFVSSTYKYKPGKSEFNEHNKSWIGVINI